MRRSALVRKNVSSSARYCSSHASYLATLPPPDHKTLSILSALSSADRIHRLNTLNPTLTGDSFSHTLRYITRWHPALDFFNWASSHPGYTHKLRSVKRMLGLLSTAGRFTEAHHILTRSGVQPDASMYATVLRAFGGEDGVDRVVEVLERMRAAGLKPDSRLLNVLLGRIKPDDGLLIVRGFPEMVDCVACTIVMDKLSKQTRMDDAGELLEFMTEKGIAPDGHLFTTLVHGYCRLGRIEEACEVLGRPGYVPTAPTYNTIIGLLCRVGRRGDGLLLLDDMAEKGCLPTVFTFGILIDSLCKEHRVDEAWGLLEAMVERGCAPNAVVLNSIFHTLCKEGRCEEAYQLVQAMVATGFVPDTATYNTLFHGFCKVDRVEKAFFLLGEMVHRGCHPNAVTYNVLLHALCKSGDVGPAKQLFRSMVEMKVRLDDYGYTTLIDGLCKAGEVGEAYGVLEDMQSRGGVPNAVSCYNALIAWLCKAGRVFEAEKLFKRMRTSGGIPDSMTFAMLVLGNCRARRLDRALEMLEQMKAWKYEPSSTIYGIVIETLEEGKRSEDARRLAREMMDKGLSLTYKSFQVLRDQWKAGNVLEERLQAV